MITVFVIILQKKNKNFWKRILGVENYIRVNSPVAVRKVVEIIRTVIWYESIN